MSELSGRMEDKKRALKSMIRKLHDGVNPEEVKEELKKLIGGVAPVDIAQIEEELIEEGMQREEVQRLCNVHLAVFRESLEKGEPIAPAGHPIQILMKEHRLLLGFADELKNAAKRAKGKGALRAAGEEMNHLDQIAEHLKESETHYVREENVLFAYLEKHGVTQPPAIMWTEHNKIKEMKKKLYNLFDTRQNMVFQGFAKQLDEAALSLAEMLSDHFYKENKILFPTALNVVEASEWKEIRRQFDEIGYCGFTPKPSEMAVEPEKSGAGRAEGGMISFETGSLSREEMELVLNSLPVDITFVDKEDTVRYFSQSKDRIFPRTKAVIGRKVQQCHPQQSLQKVVQILEDFKSHRRDMAEFWINLKGRLIYIRYFAVRNTDGKYLGCLEITQDITDVQKITGERRLLD